LEAERLGSRACRELEPRLSPSVRGGILVPGDHQVDNRALVRALLRACERTGVGVLPGRVARVLVEGERVTGVALADGGTVTAGTVVLPPRGWPGPPPGAGPRPARPRP